MASGKKIAVPYRPEWPGLEMGDKELLTLIQREGLERADELVRRRNAAIRRAEDDPLRYGVRGPLWGLCEEIFTVCPELLVMGGNRSGKSEFFAYYAVRCLVEGPVWQPEWQRKESLGRGVEVAFFHSSEQSSINQQHPRVYKYLPPEWRDLRDRTASVSYTLKNGFSGGKFVLPNGSLGYFFNYKQDVDVLQGYEFDFVWFDELVTPEFVEAVQYRLADRKGRMGLGFTPVNGYTPAVKSFVAGGRPLKTRAVDPEILPLDRVHVPNCPVGHMPVQWACKDKRRQVVFFWSSENAFGNYGEIVARVRHQPDEKKKIRAYGWADALEGGAFPRYCGVHRLTREEVLSRAQQSVHLLSGRNPKFAAAEHGAVTRYCVTDPGGAKNWVIKWYYVTPENYVVLYREWPDRQRFGEWAVPGSQDKFKAGPAQRQGAGRGILEYKRLILELEGWEWNDALGAWDGTSAELITQRRIDPRMGGATAPGASANTSIIQLMTQDQRDSAGRVVGPAMIWYPASAKSESDGKTAIQSGIQLINEALDYNPSQPVDALNCPRFYLAEDCLQSDYALQEYTGLGGQEDALKDFIDPDRYFFSSHLGYVAPGGLESTGGFYY